jgi:glycosyltransferase involved in cell wall biosynthesis
MRVSIVIPAYNEERSIGPLLKELRSFLARRMGEGEFEILAVDDGSRDRTAERILDVPGVRLVRHARNRGYGAALKSGVRSAAGEFVITMDADGQHTADHVGALLDRLEAQDLLIGARAPGEGSPLWRTPGKRVIGWLAEFLSKRRIPDLNSGLRAVKRALLQKYLHLCPDGFSFSTTSTLVLLDRGYEVEFLPIEVRRREADTSSTVTARTGLETVLLIFRLVALLDPLRLFLPASGLSVLLGLIWGAQYLWMGHGLSIGALLLLITGILLFFFGLLADQIAALRKERYE